MLNIAVVVCHSDLRYGHRNHMKCVIIMLFSKLHVDVFKEWLLGMIRQSSIFMPVHHALIKQC